MTATTRRLCFSFGISLTLSLLGLSLPLAAQQASSHARIVRLSFVEGTVTLLRPGSTQWANASVNTPIEEGFQLSTDKSSFAEVQFENGSTARVGELALLKFDQLALAESGDTLNKLTLDQGYGTFAVLPQQTGVFEVRSGDATFTPQGKAEFRIDLDEGKVRVEVFKGKVNVASPENTGTLAQNDVLEITPHGEQPYTFSQGIRRDDWDAWVAARNEQSQQALAAPPQGTITGAPAYGWSDLSQYGTWSYMDSCGYGWVPNVAGPWSPYSFGQWSWYPSFGYTWISYEPWGWLPYHYGGWMQDPTLGWAWCPGSDFGGWNPALVSWFEGPGWIGWAPLGPRPIVGGGAHPPRRPTSPLRAVNVQTFERGGPLQSREFVRNPTGGQTVKLPSVQPGLMSALPGRPVRLSSAQEAVIRGEPVRMESTLDRFFKGGGGAESPRRAPQSAFAAPPAEVRGAVSDYWAGRGNSSPIIRSGAEPSYGARSGGAFSSAGHAGSFGGARSGGGSFGGGSHGGAVSSGGGFSGGGGGHASGGGAPAGGGGGGGHH